MGLLAVKILHRHRTLLKWCKNLNNCKSGPNSTLESFKNQNSNKIFIIKGKNDLAIVTLRCKLVSG